MLCVAAPTSVVSLLMMAPICSVASLVSSESLRISSATTANPLPASPALAASIDALSARRLVWEEIPRMVSVMASTSLMRSFRLLVETLASRLTEAITFACSSNALTRSTPSSTACAVVCDRSFIRCACSSTFSKIFWISMVWAVCDSMASAVSLVLSAISLTEVWLLSILSFNIRETSIAWSNCSVSSSECSMISFAIFACLAVRSWISS